MNANDELREYNCTENYYRYSFGLTITDGIKMLCERFSCWWFADVIASYQPQLKEKEEFQVWTLKRITDSTAVVVCTDGNDKILVRQGIPFTDFKPTEATVYVEFGTALLPSEH